MSDHLCIIIVFDTKKTNQEYSKLSTLTYVTNNWNKIIKNLYLVIYMWKPKFKKKKLKFFSNTTYQSMGRLYKGTVNSKYLQVKSNEFGNSGSENKKKCLK